MELEVAHTNEETFLSVLNLLRQKRAIHNRRQGRRTVFHHRPVSGNFLSVCIQQAENAVLLTGIGLNISCHRGCRRHVTAAGPDDLSVAGEFESHIFEFLGNIGSHEQFAVLPVFHIQCSVAVACLHSLNVPQTVPVLAELLGLVREVPVVVRLVVGVSPDHQLAVMSRIVGQDAGVPFRVGPPEPELSALVDVVVAGEHCACVASVVIARHKIRLLVVDEH